MLQAELQNLATDEAVAMIYQPLHDVIQVPLRREEWKALLFFSFPGKVRIVLIVSANIIPRPKLLVLLQGLMGWISEREDNLQNHEFGHPAS